MFKSFKTWMGKAGDWLKANFRSYFWYFVAFVAGIIVCGLFQAF
jgi:hypothetical protein